MINECIDEGDAIINEFGVRGRLVEMDPPDAMRIWRPRDSRFVSLASFLPQRYVVVELRDLGTQWFVIERKHATLTRINWI